MKEDWEGYFADLELNVCSNETVGGFASAEAEEVDVVVVEVVVVIATGGGGIVEMRDERGGKEGEVDVLFDGGRD